MQITQLKEIESSDPKLMNLLSQFEKLIAELRNKELNDDVVSYINNGIEKINTATGTEKVLRKIIKKIQSEIIRIIEKEHKIVSKGHYRNMWLVLGMSVFGVPLGVVYGIAMDNMAMLGLGLPIGMLIGMGVGAAMDKKAAKEDRQLDVEIKY